MNDAALANQRMVERLMAGGSLWSAPLRQAFLATPRHHFLDRVFIYQRKRERWKEILTRDPDAENLKLIYSDRALITSLGGHGHLVPISSSSQPSLMAQMLQDLDVERGQRVLEVGAGTGYNAALLAHITGNAVVSIDVDGDVLSRAWDHLRGFPERTVQLHHADGRAGLAQSAPYERIMVTASTPDLEPAWLGQLVPGGKLLAPLVLAPGLEFTVAGCVHESVFVGRLTRAAYFMPLRNEGQTGTSPPDSPLTSAIPDTYPALWAGWFTRRHLRQSWSGFSQSLALFALLRGLQVRYLSLENDPCIFGVGNQDTWCWFGRCQWYAKAAGVSLGWQVWHDFLDAGAPWPTDYRLTMACGMGVEVGTSGIVRQGPKCRQHWELPEKRERPAWM